MATATRTDEELIKELHDGFVEANKTADTPYLRAHMAPGPEGFRWYNLNKSVYVGMDHICALWDFLASMNSKGELGVVEEQIRINGDLGFVTYILSFKADFGPMGKIPEMTARTTEIWERLDGEWKMVHFHCSEHEPGGWEGGR